MNALEQVSLANFHQSVLRSERPVLVDFTTERCAPCQALAPVLKSAARDFADKVDVLQVDVEKEPQLARFYQVRSVPAQVLFKDGEPVDSHRCEEGEPDLYSMLGAVSDGDVVWPPTQRWRRSGGRYEPMPGAR